MQKAVSERLWRLAVKVSGAARAPGRHEVNLAICLALGSLAMFGGSAAAAGPKATPAGGHTYDIVITLSGDQYEDAQNNLLADPHGTRCLPLHNVPTPAPCWTWNAKHLGHGVYTIAQPRLEGVHLVWTFTYTDSHGDTLTGSVAEGYLLDPSRLDALTHANRYVQTYTFTGGTGRYTAVTGVLIGSTTSISVSVDRATRIAHTKFNAKAVGRLTFGSKL
jgi:hypothetical protein